MKASNEATLSSLISGRINAIPFRDSATFIAGDILAEIDCSIYVSEASAANAERDAASATANSRKSLFSRGGIGKLEVDLANSQAAAAEARARTQQLKVDECRIRAPYAGKVVNTIANPSEYVEPGQPILSIVGTGALYVEIIAPSEWLLWAAPGTKGTLKLDAIDKAFGITIDSLGPIVDTVSRTIKLSATLSDNADKVLPGMSGRATLERAK